MEKKNYLVTTVCAEFGRTYTFCTSLCSLKDLEDTDFKEIPTKRGQTITIIDFVKDLGTTEKWITTITKIA